MDPIRITDSEKKAIYVSFLNALFTEFRQLQAEVCPLSRRDPTTEGKPTAVGNAVQSTAVSGRGEGSPR
jgi:hypothetical protein